MKKIFCVLLCFSFAASAHADLYDGLVNYYALDGDFLDTASGLSGNTSTFDDEGFQPDASVTFAPSPFGQTAVFNGDDVAYIEVEDSDDLVFTDRDLTISGWFNVNQFDQSWQGVIAHGESSDYRVARRSGSNVLSYAGGVGDIPTDDITGPNINNGDWNHFAAITEEGVSTRLWVNGQLVSTSADAASIADNGSGRLMIGGNPDTSGDGFRTWDGMIDDIGMWERVLTPEEVVQIYSAGADGVALAGAADYGVAPPFAVGPRAGIGSNVESASRTNLTYGDPVGDNSPGLLQSWYGVANPGTKAGVNDIALANEPAVEPFHSSNGSTWWTGNEVVTGLPQYPDEVADFIADRSGENYTVVLQGEIMIDEPGTVKFLDGVDDFTYLAIDLNQNGTAGDEDGEVLINDNSWTSALSTANGGAPIVEADFDDAGWYAIEFNMAEGGGGDHGMLYWDALDDQELFPTAQGEGIFDALDAADLQIPDTHLRGPEGPAPLLSGDWEGAVPEALTGYEFDVNPADGTSDVITLADNPDAGVYTSVLNVDGTEIHVNPLSDPANGDTFQIFVADSIIGTPTIATEGWTYDAATGSVIFGSVVDGCSQGDLDGSGEVDFADFLILSGNFGNAATACSEGDIDGSGTVDFADFLALSGNFGNSVGAASSVPEPSSFALLGFAGLVLGYFRRRR